MAGNSGGIFLDKVKEKLSEEVTFALRPGGGGRASPGKSQGKNTPQQQHVQRPWRGEGLARARSCQKVRPAGRG